MEYDTCPSRPRSVAAQRNERDVARKLATEVSAQFAGRLARRTGRIVGPQVADEDCRRILGSDRLKGSNARVDPNGAHVDRADVLTAPRSRWRSGGVREGGRVEALLRFLIRKGPRTRALGVRNPRPPRA